MAILHRVRALVTGVAGGPAYLNFHFQGEPTAASAQENGDKVAGLCEAVDTYWPSYITWDVEDVVVTLDSITGQPTGTDTITGASGVGESASDIIPTGAQVLIQWRTGHFANGREIRGRTNLPYMTVATLGGGGVVDGTDRTAIAAAANVFADDATGSQFVIWSRTTGLIPPVTVASVWAQFAVLRSRRD